jgi:Transglutaminase-like superfamily
MTITAAERAFYTTQSGTSDPGEFAGRFDGLPADPSRVATIVSGLVLHPMFLGRRHIAHPHADAGDAEVRPVRELLRRIVERDSRPLDVARPAECRVIGTCRHYALVAVSLFRHHRVPARVRVGFARYFVPGFHEDHWLCEYWDGRRWCLLDAELGEAAAREDYAVDFAAPDVPRERFLTAGEAWLALRRDVIDAETCGVSFIPGIRGAWFVGASLLRDLAALNARELLPWDYWGVARAFSRPGTKVSQEARARLDQIAAIMAGPAPGWRAVREIYETSDDLRVPATVLSFPAGQPIEAPV